MIFGFADKSIEYDILPLLSLSLLHLFQTANQETIVELIGFAQRVMGPAAPKKTPSEAHAAQAHAAGFDAVDGRAPSPDAPEEEKKVCSFFLTYFRKINIFSDDF